MKGVGWVVCLIRLYLYVGVGVEAWVVIVIHMNQRSGVQIFEITSSVLISLVRYISIKLQFFKQLEYLLL